MKIIKVRNSYRSVDRGEGWDLSFPCSYCEKHTRYYFVIRIYMENNDKKIIKTHQHGCDYSRLNKEDGCGPAWFKRLSKNILRQLHTLKGTIIK